jgi:hypothetical protein
MTAERAWRLLGALGMILGLASLIAATMIQWFVQPADPSGTPVDIARENPSIWLLVSLLSVLGPLFWVAGVFAITSRVTGRGWILTTLGGAITALGVISGVGHLALFFGLAGDAAGAGVDAGTAQSLLQADDAGVVSNLLLYGFLVGFSLGPILLTIGLRVAKKVPVWVPVAAIVMVVASFVGGIPAGAVQLLAALFAFLPMVVVLVRREPAAAA